MFMPDAGSHHGPPYRQRPRQRAGPGDDATDARNTLHRRPQAHTTLHSHREHAGLGRSDKLWSRAQGDGSDDDAGKQLHVRPRIPHLVPRHYPQPGHSPTLLSQTPVDAPHSHSHGRLRSATAAAAAAAAASAAQPKFRAPGLHLELLRDPSWKTRLHFYLFPLLVLAHVPIQTFLDFNAVFILIE
jgi:hypothetical protein